MVATPIGNLQDITLRAVAVLKSVTVIAAEDTRVTSRLLQAHNITTPMLALHQHNEREAAAKVLERLAQGQVVALVSDAGTPAVSDPGALLVAAARQAGYQVVPIPGANAALAALSASGCDSSLFLFYGFLPARPQARRAALESLKTLPYTLVFYEAPHRIVELVEDIAAVLGAERRVTLARELTKLFETIHACPAGEARAWLEADLNRQRGEFVVLVSGAPAPTDPRDAQAERVLSLLLAELPLKQAVALAVKITGGSKNMLYQRALELKDSAEC